ncbi:MAG: nitroreductase [Alphaproteobacteria bacterium]|nr:nitroreductase [Alphaproteobacteria bacterium]
MNQAFVDFLASRRSRKPDQLVAPAPSQQELAAMLKIAARVPDHKRLAPWRFIIFEGDARAQFGEIIAKVCAANAQQQPQPSEQRLEVERGRFLRAPLVVAVIAKLTDHPAVPQWEQSLSAGVAAYNLCLAANAYGYATSWLTEWMAYDVKICSALGLGENERVAGFVHIGTAGTEPVERARPDMQDIVSHWTGAE